MKRTKAILGYSRSSDSGGKIVEHHINAVFNTLISSSRGTKMAIYVIEWNETDDNPGDTGRHEPAGDTDERPQEGQRE